MPPRKAAGAAAAPKTKAAPAKATPAPKTATKAAPKAATKAAATKAAATKKTADAKTANAKSVAAEKAAPAAATKTAAPKTEKAAPKKKAAVEKKAAPVKAAPEKVAEKKAVEKKAAPAKPAASKKRKLEEASGGEDEQEAGSQPKKAKTTAAATSAAKAKAKAPARKKTPVPAAKRGAKKTAASNEEPAAPAPEPESEVDKENEQPNGELTNGVKKRGASVVSAKEPKAAEEEEKAPPAKKVKAAAAPAAVKKPAFAKIGVKINEAPHDPLDIFVFGEGSSGELGLGSVKLDGKKPIDVKRPRLNPKLSAKDVGVVQIACGGMHAIALTRDNKILTWGVNDQGALGRDTTWDGGLRDVDAEEGDSEDEDDDTGVNPRESNPAEIDRSDISPDTKFVQVAASDSASFALTEDGRVYGWGTFRASDGILGFTKDIMVQRTPMLLPEPRKVKQLATGSNHVMALDAKGKLYTWGCPEQNQLGRRCVQRDLKESALRPGGVGFKRGVHIEKIACGSYHSFAVDQNGKVYAWGLNNFGELGIEEGAGDSDAAVLDATVVTPLADYQIVDVAGGEHHSLACTAEGKLLTWGRIDGHQVGLASDVFTEENSIFDEFHKPRILKHPTVVPDVPAMAKVTAGTDNSFALTQDGKAYSWGFSANYQTGQGTSDDVETPTLIDNTAVRGRKLVYAGAGGQFSILASVAEDVEMNGV